MQISDSYFHDFIKANAGQLVVQPRMGFSDMLLMRQGLARVKQVDGPSIGTITLDSFTRTGDFYSATQAIKNKTILNGYPIVSYGKKNNQLLLDGLRTVDFPVQVRHGCTLPDQIFEAIIDAGLDATEGGPISYCFPYSRVPIKKSIQSWKNCSRSFAAIEGKKCHIESFGGCMMGQLCPPSMLIAITIVEALFFKQAGLKSYSVSLGQGSNNQQDIAALKALRKIGEKYLGPSEDWHIVYYTFMGKFPYTIEGARAIRKDSILVAKVGGAERLIVKTANEAHQIPTIDDNIEALEQALEDFGQQTPPAFFEQDTSLSELIYEEAEFLINVLLNLDNQLDKAIELAFSKAYWDVPFCLHPDNHNRTVAKLDDHGNIVWANPGKIPFPKSILKNNFASESKLSSEELLKMLSYNQIKYDSLCSNKETLNKYL